jgi:hypothetical protein
MLLVFDIKLPKNQDTEAFVKFMQMEYFPAVDKRSTRAGQVTSLKLLQRKNIIDRESVNHEFFLHVGWSGVPWDRVRVDDQEVVRKYESFSLHVEYVGTLDEVAGLKTEQQ